MRVEYTIQNKSHQDGTFFADGQWVTLLPGSITTVGSRPADISANLTIVKKLVNDKEVVTQSIHKPTVITKPSKPVTPVVKTSTLDEVLEAGDEKEEEN